MCAPCFHSTDHKGHTTSVSIAADDNGCCDCGDSEAWKVELRCKIHSLEAGSTHQHEEIPSWLIERMQIVMATLLDFVLDTFIRSPKDLESLSTDDIHDDAVRGLEEEESILQLYNQTHESKRELERSTAMMYTCVLWNDEINTFRKVINRIKLAIDCSYQQAKSIAEKADKRVSKRAQY
jgi:E3 ubiquitin-protein ligase UBR1